jgi:hypothetical protein
MEKFKILLLLPVILLTACGTPKIPGYEGPKALDRGAVVSGARDCINGKMKPEVVYLSQKTDHGVVLVPVDVHCNVYNAYK